MPRKLGWRSQKALDTKAHILPQPNRTVRDEKDETIERLSVCLKRVMTELYDLKYGKPKEFES